MPTRAPTPAIEDVALGGPNTIGDRQRAPKSMKEMTTLRFQSVGLIVINGNSRFRASGRSGPGSAARATADPAHHRGG